MISHLIHTVKKLEVSPICANRTPHGKYYVRDLDITLENNTTIKITLFSDIKQDLEILK